MSSFLRRVVLTRTITTATLNLTREISTAGFTNPDVYKNAPILKQEAIDTVIRFAALCGIDAGGGDSVELPYVTQCIMPLHSTDLLFRGAFHSGGPSYGDSYERLTGLVKDKAGRRLYFYRTSDGTFWDRVHIPRNTLANQALWVNQPVYQVVTKVQFDKYVSVMHSVFVLTDRIFPGCSKKL